MFSVYFSRFRKSSVRRAPRPRVVSRRLWLEPLEERAVPSGGPGPSPIISGAAADTSIVAVIDNSGGGPGPSGSPSGGNGSSGAFLSGPGYPLAPTTGPARPTPGTVIQPQTTTTLVPMTGTPGGPGPTVALVPVVTGGGKGT